MNFWSTFQQSSDDSLILLNTLYLSISLISYFSHQFALPFMLIFFAFLIFSWYSYQSKTFKVWISTVYLKIALLFFNISSFNHLISSFFILENGSILVLTHTLNQGNWAIIRIVLHAKKHKPMKNKQVIWIKLSIRWKSKSYENEISEKTKQHLECEHTHIQKELVFKDTSSDE